MRERPILFSGPMVRAILAGAKTQTRRVIRWPDWIDHNRDVFAADLGKGQHVGQFKDGRVVRSMVPAYVKGDRLWVRETWAGSRRWLMDRAMNPSHADVLWRASYGDKAPDTTRGWDGVWRPSIFMPRWASRLTLDVVDVRVQRLQDISEGDAKAEGIAPNPVQRGEWVDYPMGTSAAGWLDPRDSFWSLWDSINGKRPGCSWRDNPWVWAITFRRLP